MDERGAEHETGDGAFGYLFLSPETAGEWPPRPELVSIPESLHDHVDAVLRDFQQPTVVQLTVGYYVLEGTLDFGGVMFTQADGSAFGFGVPTSGPEAEIRVALADGLQENFSEIQEIWGDARPKCPLHAHPLVAVNRDGIAWWMCPLDGRRITRIGELCHDDVHLDGSHEGCNR